MKKTILSFLVLLVISLVSACSSSTATPGSVQPPATGPAVQPGTTPGVPQTGNGTKVDITLADNTIQASTTTFQAGVPYEFVITNTGRHAHNFNINPPVAEAGSLDAALNNALLAVPQDQLSPGQTATVTFTFPESAVGKSWEFSCLIRRHYEDGMKVTITVLK